MEPGLAPISPDTKPINKSIRLSTEIQRYMSFSGAGNRQQSQGSRLRFITLVRDVLWGGLSAFPIVFLQAFTGKASCIRQFCPGSASSLVSTGCCDIPPNMGTGVVP